MEWRSVRQPRRDSSLHTDARDCRRGFFRAYLPALDSAVDEDPVVTSLINARTCQAGDAPVSRLP